MKKILFVDDETRILDALKRMLRGMRNEWQMAFASGGQEALEILKRDSFDVVVADMRMPGMDGYRLLNEVKEIYPDIVRIILSGYSDEKGLLNSIGPVHQFLSKPCDAETLKSTVARACAMRGLLENDSLIKVISRIESLPSPPLIYTEIMKEVNSEEGSLTRVGEIISKDVGMSAKILQLVNSSFFGLAAHVSSPARAVAMLGLATVKALVLVAKIFSQFSGPDMPGYSIANLWDHSIATACLAKKIAAHLKQQQSQVDDSFLAGLLHDIGKLVLMDRLPAVCQEIVRVKGSTGCPLWKAEQRIMGTTHAQIGAYLLGIWGFSEAIVEGVALHHRPGEYANDSPGILTAVHLANGFEHRNNPELADGPGLDMEYLSKFGINDRIESLQSVCNDPVTLGEVNV